MTAFFTFPYFYIETTVLSDMQQKINEKTSHHAFHTMTVGSLCESTVETLDIAQEHLMQENSRNEAKCEMFHQDIHFHLNQKIAKHDFCFTKYQAR